MKCPKCGAENPEGSLFCQECGTNLASQTEGEYNIALRRVSMILVILGAIANAFVFIYTYGCTAFYPSTMSYTNPLLVIICIIEACAFAMICKQRQSEVNKVLLWVWLGCFVMGIISCLVGLFSREIYYFFYGTGYIIFVLLPYGLPLIAFIIALACVKKIK